MHANGGREPEAASSQDRHSVQAHWLSTAIDIATVGACRRTLRLLISTVVAYVILAGSSGSAQNSAVHVSQLSHTAWRLRDGALPGLPSAVTQTKTGTSGWGHRWDCTALTDKVSQRFRCPRGASAKSSRCWRIGTAPSGSAHTEVCFMRRVARSKRSRTMSRSSS